MSASNSGSSSWFQRHPALSVISAYALFMALTFACMTSPRLFSDHSLLLGLPLLGAASIGGLLHHISRPSPISRLERFGRIFGATVVLLLIWFAAIFLHAISSFSSFR
jgi:hypothetical protein